MKAVETVKVIRNTCLHCKHVWFPRGAGRPGVCPRCKRHDWDTPKRRKTA